MRSLLLTLLAIAGLVCSSSAYILKTATYYASGEARPSYYNGDTNNNARGIYLFKYLPESKTLDYRVLSTILNLGTVTLNGPASCTVGQGEFDCYRNEGAVVFTLGKGLTPSEGAEQAGHQMISGTVTLDSVQESMLFNNEFYILINSAIPDPDNENVYIDNPVMRGAVYIFNNGRQGSNRLYFNLIFGPNGGEFDPENPSQSKNEGFGRLEVNPTAATNQVVLYLFNTITQPGKYFLNCDFANKQLFSSDNTGGQNPSAIFGLTLNFADNEKLLLSELLLEQRCYISITSAEFPDGDMFSWITPMAQYSALSLGANEDPPVTSPYFAFHTFDFDYASKVLRITTFTNLTTDTITDFDLHSATDDKVLCNIGDGDPFPYLSISCQLNGTAIPDLEAGNLYFRITASSTTNPPIRLRGNIVSAGAVGSSALAIGLGVGLGVGIPVLAAAGVGTYFLVKKRGGSSGKI